MGHEVMCSLTYARLVQTERNGACSKLPRCSLTYAKLQKKHNPSNKIHQKQMPITVLLLYQQE